MSLPPLVDAAWVQEHLGEPDLVLGDVRGPNAHQRGHLPGSIPLVLGSPPPLATRETVQEFAVEVQRRLGRHGVTGQERLVLYDRGDCVGAAASQQAALVAGHPQVSVLAGGVAAWPGELEQGPVELQKTKTALEPRLEAVPTWEELRERLDDLERALEGQPYLSGREFGLADVGYLPWILRGLDRFGLELGPATAAWLDRCSERPGVAAERAVVSAL